MKRTNAAKRFLTCSLCLLLAGLTLIMSACTQKVAASPEINETESQETTAELSEITTPEPIFKPMSYQESMVSLGLNMLTGVSGNEQGNQLVSPISLAYCLGMLMNGASGETRKQLEAMFGMDTEFLNESLSSYARSIEQNTDDAKVSLADSIWIKDDESLTVYPEYLQKIAMIYDSQVFSAPFDESTRNDINSWVKKNTDGMIESILDKTIDPSSIMYLINTLAFDAKWMNEYNETNIIDGQFRNADGSQSDAKMLCSIESDYFEGDDFIGFTKYYKGNYAFKAILPKENADIYEFAAGLTYEDWKKTEEDVYEDSDGMIISFKASARIPEFEFDSNDMNLNDVLIKMGAKDMFNPDLADFSALGCYEDANICCSKVAQKTHIELNRQGTKAAAATRAEMVYATSVGDFTTKTVNVFLDRPFVYAIVDTTTDLPLFIGIVSQLD